MEAPRTRQSGSRRQPRTSLSKPFRGLGGCRLQAAEFASALQAGGRWFEPSTAHFRRPLLPRGFRQHGVACDTLARGRLGALSSHFCPIGALHEGLQPPILVAVEPHRPGVEPQREIRRGVPSGPRGIRGSAVEARDRRGPRQLIPDKPISAAPERDVAAVGSTCLRLTSRRSLVRAQHRPLPLVKGGSPHYCVGQAGAALATRLRSGSRSLP